MNRMSSALGAVVFCACAACGHGHEMSAPSIVRTVEITDVVNPMVLYAKAGEEVRWQNLRTNPVRLGFLGIPAPNDLGCKKGVTNILGDINDLVTITPGNWVSLCPTHSGALQYNIWFDAENPKGAISPTATVEVDAGGRR